MRVHYDSKCVSTLLVVAVLIALAGSPRAEGNGETETITLPGDVPLEMVRIPAGKFMMGSTQGRGDEVPVHEVTITQDFQLGKFEITKVQWKAVMETTPWLGKDYVLNDPKSPAVYVSWNDGQSFITALNGLTGIAFRLPTEAEWEYVCRAGTTTEYYFGDSSTNLNDYAWWDGNQSQGEGYAQVVGQFLPNPWGFYDMHGNVFELCNDWYSPGYYSVSLGRDPPGPSSGSLRVKRGGSWDNEAEFLRSADRGWDNPTGLFDVIRTGFRVARTVSTH